MNIDILHKITYLELTHPVICYPSEVPFGFKTLDAFLTFINSNPNFTFYRMYIDYGIDGKHFPYICIIYNNLKYHYRTFCEDERDILNIISDLLTPKSTGLVDEIHMMLKRNKRDIIIDNILNK